MFKRFACIMLSMLSLFFLLIFSVPAPADAATVTTYQTLINKQHTLSSDYIPYDLVNVSDYINANSSVLLRKAAAEALDSMDAAARRAGVTTIHGTSGYRSYETQTYLSNRKTNYFKKLGYSSSRAYELGAQIVAPPGASEHQSGLSIDVTSVENGHDMTESFAKTKAGKWLAANCWKYGFILRYPNDKTDITGYIYEAWHFRYVGSPHAEYMTKNKLTLEEYLELLKGKGALSYTTESGEEYVIYYSKYNISNTVDGSVVSVSTAESGTGGYIITTRPAFYDLAGHWSENEVRSLISSGVIGGYPDKTFRPQRTVNRAELVTMLDRLYILLFEQNTGAPEAGVTEAGATEAGATEAGATEAETGLIETEAAINPFGDVNEDDYFYQSLLNTYNRGLLSQFLYRENNGLLYFDPQTAVLRCDMARSLAPLMRDLPEADASSLILPDLAAADTDLQQAVNLLINYGVIKGDNGNFNAENSVTRAQLAAAFNRVIECFRQIVTEDDTVKEPEPATDNTVPDVTEE